MAENNKGKDILETFIKCNLHPKGGKWIKWPKQITRTVCLIEYSSDDTDNPDQTVIERNILESHAEIRLIDCIKEDLTKIKSITIYISRSPCIDCGGMLMELKQKFPGLQIKVKFTSFYDIQRPSCKESGRCCKKDVPGTFTMLRKLDALPFKEEDWRHLIVLLKANDVQKGNPTSDLDGDRYGTELGSWRNWEDTNMMADYNKLSQAISLNTPNKNTSSTYKPSRPSKDDHATGSTGDGKSRRKLDY